MLPRSNNLLAVESAEISWDDATTCAPRRHSGNGGGMCPNSPLDSEHAMTAWCIALQPRTVSVTPAAGPGGVRTMTRVVQHKAAVIMYMARPACDGCCALPVGPVANTQSSCAFAKITLLFTTLLGLGDLEQ